MTDPKKRLEKILNDLISWKYTTEEAIIEILKEFVHKDNLPTETEVYEIIKEEMSCHPHRNWDFERLPIENLAIKREENLTHLKGIAEAIRKLIEGKKGI